MDQQQQQQATRPQFDHERAAQTLMALNGVDMAYLPYAVTKLLHTAAKLRKVSFNEAVQEFVIEIGKNAVYVRKMDEAQEKQETKIILPNG